MPLLSNPRARRNNPAYTVTLFRGTLERVARAERRRSAEWDEWRSGAILLDHRDGLHELKNVASDPSHANTVLGE